MVLETYVDICSEDIRKVFDSKPSIDDSMVTAKFILHGEMSLINDDKYASKNIEYTEYDMEDSKISRIYKYIFFSK